MYDNAACNCHAGWEGAETGACSVQEINESLFMSSSGRLRELYEGLNLAVWLRQAVAGRDKSTKHSAEGKPLPSLPPPL
jgi:hypothetical protein